MTKEMTEAYSISSAKGNRFREAAEATLFSILSHGFHAQGWSPKGLLDRIGYAIGSYNPENFENLANQGIIDVSTPAYALIAASGLLKNSNRYASHLLAIGSGAWLYDSLQRSNSLDDLLYSVTSAGATYLAGYGIGRLFSSRDNT